MSWSLEWHSSDLITRVRCRARVTLANTRMNPSTPITLTFGTWRVSSVTSKRSILDLTAWSCDEKLSWNLNWNRLMKRRNLSQWFRRCQTLESLKFHSHGRDWRWHLDQISRQLKANVGRRSPIEYYRQLFTVNHLNVCSLILLIVIARNCIEKFPQR